MAIQSLKSQPYVMDEGQKKDGSIAAERISFLIGKLCHFKVWWSTESQISSPNGDQFQAILLDCFPVGRDYYFCFITDEPNPKRAIIKTAAVLQIMEA